MRIKKFNAALAAVVLGGAIFTWGGVTRLGSVIGGLLQGKSPAAVTHQPTASEQSKWSPSHRAQSVTSIPWRSRQGSMPGNVTLNKWVEGDRVYYQMSGPLNPEYRNTGANNFQNPWGSFTACEVFFPRGGGRFDQWLITPTDAVILHYDKPRRHVSKSPLPSSRYRTEINGDWITVTFWCSRRDAPANIVFNCHGEGMTIGGHKMSWVSTGAHRESTGWNHHLSERWRYP